HHHYSKNDNVLDIHICRNFDSCNCNNGASYYLTMVESMRYGDWKISNNKSDQNKYCEKLKIIGQPMHENSKLYLRMVNEEDKKKEKEEKKEKINTTLLSEII